MGELTVVSPPFPFVALRLLVDDDLVDLTLLFSTFSCTCSFRRDDRQLGVEGLPLSQRSRGCLSGVDDDFLVEFCAIVAFESTFTPSLPCRGGVPIAVKIDESEYNNNECWGGGERERVCEQNDIPNNALLVTKSMTARYRANLLTYHLTLHNHSSFFFFFFVVTPR